MRYYYDDETGEKIEVKEEKKHNKVENVMHDIKAAKVSEKPAKKKLDWKIAVAGLAIVGVLVWAVSITAIHITAIAKEDTNTSSRENGYSLTTQPSDASTLINTDNLFADVTEAVETEESVDLTSEVEESTGLTVETEENVGLTVTTESPVHDEYYQELVEKASRSDLDTEIVGVIDPGTGESTYKIVYDYPEQTVVDITLTDEDLSFSGYGSDTIVHDFQVKIPITCTNGVSATVLDEFNIEWVLNSLAITGYWLNWDEFYPENSDWESTIDPESTKNYYGEYIKLENLYIEDYAEFSNGFVYATFEETDYYGNYEKFYLILDFSEFEDYGNLEFYEDSITVLGTLTGFTYDGVPIFTVSSYDNGYWVVSMFDDPMY